MKTLQQISLTVVVFLSILIAAAGTSPALKAKNEKEVKVEVSSAELQKQCGVTNTQITTYLQECSHHHTVYWVQDIPGTCDSKAGIENCNTATVYVSEGIIVGHLDVSGYCD